MFFFVKRIMKLYPIFIFSAQTLEISGINWNLILQKAWRSHHKNCTLLFLAFLRKTKWKTQYFITIFFSFSNFTLLFSGKSIFQRYDFDELNNGNKKNRKRKTHTIYHCSLMVCNCFTFLLFLVAYFCKDISYPFLFKTSSIYNKEK